MFYFCSNSNSLVIGTYYMVIITQFHYHLIRLQSLKSIEHRFDVEIMTTVIKYKIYTYFIFIFNNYLFKHWTIGYLNCVEL